MKFPLIEVLLSSALLVALANLYLWLKTDRKKRFYRLCALYLNSYLGFHALYVLIIVETIFPEIRFYDKFPFALMYGPFLYFAVVVLAHKKLSKRKIITHSAPFFLFLIGFIVLLIMNIPDELAKTYSYSLNIACILSYGSYGLLTFIYTRKQNIGRVILSVGAVLLLFMTLITITFLLSRDQITPVKTASHLIRAQVYGCMLGATLLVLREMIFQGKKVKEKNVATSEVAEAKYEKSMLPSEQLETYAQNLEHLMRHEKVFLQQDLSLQKLAQTMNVPPHHLTQLLSLRINRTFHEYVNQFRVDYACTLLKKDGPVSIEVIAQRCGFNSKASFNRNFKAFQGCTPTEYRTANQNSAF